MALSKVDGSVSYAYCQCPAGQVGTCSHMFDFMKLVAKWAIDKFTKIPEMKACTSKPCSWSVPQSRGKLFKSPISEISLMSPASKKQKTVMKTLPQKVLNRLYMMHVLSHKEFSMTVKWMRCLISCQKKNLRFMPYKF